MPATSDKQARTMRAAANDAGFARRMGIPQDVAREFVAADKSRPLRPSHLKQSAEQRKAGRYGGKK